MNNNKKESLIKGKLEMLCYGNNLIYVTQVNRVFHQLEV